MRKTSVQRKTLSLVASIALALFLCIPHSSVQGYSQTTYYSQSAYYSQSTYYTEATYSTTVTKDAAMNATLDITNSVSKGSGTFVIDHPLDPENKLLYHSFVESPDVKNIYDGITTLDAHGEAVVALPEYFEALNTDFRYQYTALGVSAPNLYIKEEVQNNHFTISGGTPGTKVSWQVTGIRHDPYILANPIIPEVEKGPDALVEKGESLGDIKSNVTDPKNNTLLQTLASWFQKLVASIVGFFGK